MAPQQVDRAADAVQAASSQAQSSANRFLKWVEDNSRLVLAASVGTAVAGAGAYYYFGTPKDPKGTSGSSKSSKKSKSEKASDKTSERTSDPRDRLNDPNGPLLQEASEQDLLNLSVEEIARLPADKRESLAQSLKSKGNTAYQKSKFNEAIDFYTRAIAARPTAVFYANRAACYSNLSRPRDVLQDCDSALELDPRYVKAMHRRGNAAKQLGTGLDPEKHSPDFEEKTNYLFRALLDFTSLMIISEAQDRKSSEEIEAVLKELTQLKAKQAWRTREPRLPSSSTLAMFLDEFRPRPLPELSDNASQGDRTLLMAYEALQGRNYPHAFSLANESLEQDISSDVLKALAFNLKGTFWLAMNRLPEALDFFSQAVELNGADPQHLIKQAVVYRRQGNVDAALATLQKAEQIAAQDAEVYYQRGHVYDVQGKEVPDKALKEFERAIELDDNFMYAYVHRAAILAKQGRVEVALARMRAMIQRFPDAPIAYNYYGEVLMAVGRFAEAIGQFDKAIEVTSSRGLTRDPTALVNKAQALAQSTQDPSAAEPLMQQALEIEGDHEAAVGLYAQMLQAKMDLAQAAQFYQRSAEVAREEEQLELSVMLELSTLAQHAHVARFPEDVTLLQTIRQREAQAQMQAQMMAQMQGQA